MTGHVFWDTNLLIYWIEQSPQWRKKMGDLYDWQKANHYKIITSALSLGEILVHPMRISNIPLAQSYARIIGEMGCIHFGVNEAWRFSELRARHPALRPPDAIQLACASICGVDYFFTNDDRLCRYKVNGIGRILGLEEWQMSLPGK
ncbi:MAG TPA: PIN domain-containing protein [Kiritimatiellia bacterium]|nr:PIN domain-containing protein [Kiritimatiellia bacterium]